MKIKSIHILKATFIIALATLINTGHAQVTKKNKEFHISDFITIEDANKVLEKPTYANDSAYKQSPNLTHYRFDYVAVFKDSTSKGKLFFTYEAYKTDTIAADIFQSIKTENEKLGAITKFDAGANDGFWNTDKLNQPFIIIRKGNKLFKFKVYYLTDKTMLSELQKLAKKVVAAH